MAKILTLNAKCSDMCVSTLEVDGVNLGEHVGYAPRLNHKIGGDYIEIQVDLETGQIVDWVKPDEEAMKELMEQFGVEPGEEP